MTRFHVKRPPSWNGTLAPAIAVLALLVSGLLASCGGGANGLADTGPTRAAAMAAVAIAPEQAADQLMDFGENGYPQYFPGHEATLSLAPFVYRHYAATGIYLGVVVTGGMGFQLDGVYVMGGPFGDAPRYVGQVTDFITPVAPVDVAAFDGHYAGSMLIVDKIDPGGIDKPIGDFLSLSFSITDGVISTVVVTQPNPPPGRVLSSAGATGTVSSTGAVNLVLPDTFCATVIPAVATPVTWTGVAVISASGAVATGAWNKQFVPTPPGVETCPGFNGTWTATRTN